MATLIGTTDADSIVGTSEQDWISGEAGNDTLYGSGGTDTLMGGDGADLLHGAPFPHALPIVWPVEFPPTGASYAAATAGVMVSFSGTRGVGSAGEASGDTLINIDWLEGSSFGDTLLGGASLSGLGGDDSLSGAHLFGGDGDDSLSGIDGLFHPNWYGEGFFFDGTRLSGGGGNNVIIGGRSADQLVPNLSSGHTAVYQETSSAQIGITKGLDGKWLVSHNEGGGGLDTLIGIHTIEFSDGAFRIDDVPNSMMLRQALGFEDVFSVFDAAQGTSYHFGAVYSGPVSHLQKALFGTAQGEIMSGTMGNDQINSFGGTDAVDAGAGDDVIDGGTGSNFLTGGAGRDVFFLDGRDPAGEPTWSSITDWEAGEQLSIFGFRPGVSRYLLHASDGASGFTGVTLHADLDGNGVIDNSVTWSGRSLADLPMPIIADGLMWFA